VARTHRSVNGCDIERHAMHTPCNNRCVCCNDGSNNNTAILVPELQVQPAPKDNEWRSGNRFRRIGQLASVSFCTGSHNFQLRTFSYLSQHVSNPGNIIWSCKYVFETMPRTAATTVTTEPTSPPARTLRWSDDGRDVPASDMEWKFSSPHHHHGSPASVLSSSQHLITITYLHSQQSSTRTRVPRRWLLVVTNQNDDDVEPNRIARYLCNLREDVVDGAGRCYRKCYVDPTFSTDALREWRSGSWRLWSSQTGRKSTWNLVQDWNDLIHSRFYKFMVREGIFSLWEDTAYLWHINIRLAQLYHVILLIWTITLSSRRSYKSEW